MNLPYGVLCFASIALAVVMILIICKMTAKADKYFTDIIQAECQKGKADKS